MLHVLILYKAIIPSVRLCGHCQMELLEKQGRVAYRHGIAAKVAMRDLDWADVVVMCRLDNLVELRLARVLRQAGKRVAYVIDDDLLNVPEGFSSAPYYALPETKAAIQGLLEESDAILSPSKLLLAKYASGKPAFLIEEPAIDPIPARPYVPGEPVRIGFAGSIDRAGDVERILKHVLPKLKERYGAGVAFVFFGAIPEFAKALGATCVPYTLSYDEYRSTLNGLRLDIGLAPLPDTPFHSCKHYNKFVEYAASSIVGVFSDVKPYDRLREQFGWELLCGNTPEAWEAALTSLIDHPEELNRQKTRLDELTRTVFSVETSANDMLRALESLGVTEPRRKNDFWQLVWTKVLFVWTRGVNALRRHGLKTIAIAFERMKNRG